MRRGSIRSATARHGLTFPQISDNAGDVCARFAIASQPALVVIDTDGTTRTFLGAVDEAALDTALTAATSP